MFAEIAVGADILSSTTHEVSPHLMNTCAEFSTFPWLYCLSDKFEGYFAESINT